MSAHHDSHGPSREELNEIITRPVAPELKKISLIVGVLGLVLFVVGAATGQARAWQAWHVNWLFFTSIASAGVLTAAVQRITTARWSRAVVRIMESLVLWLPIAFVMVLLTVSLGKGHIFPWTHELSELPHEKQVWLGSTFWTTRTIVIFGLITWLSVWFVYRSVRLDVGILPEWGAAWARGLRARMRAGFGEERRELHSTHSLHGRLAVFLALAFGLGWVVLSWDLAMSLQPLFYSTMYGWQFFVGGWLEALMLFALLMRFWRNRLGAHDVITESHFHDIGKLCFAFTVLWAYVTFGQFLVIWYGNVPEETHFFRLRFIAPWTPLTVALIFLVFALPFFGLLGKYPKIWTPTMAFFALCSLVGMWLHRYLEVYPPIYVQTMTSLPIGIWEIGITIGFLGLFLWSHLAFMDAFPRVRVFMLTSPYRDEVQVPVDPRTMEPLPAHE